MFALHKQQQSVNLWRIEDVWQMGMGNEIKNKMDCEFIQSDYLGWGRVVRDIEVLRSEKILSELKRF